MFDEFVKQARRLLSSKSNAGRQVPTLADTFHSVKQIMLAIAIILLLGYSQFRDHFSCQDVNGADNKVVTSFCLINGTTTVLHMNPSHWKPKESLPHVGLHFVVDGGDFKVLNHNYMRSLWLLLILLALCSWAALRYRASLFHHDVLQALLQLVGYESSRLVQAAEQARPYETLSSMSSDLNQELKHRLEDDPKFAALPKSEQAIKRLELVESHVNIYDHKLDYFPNQFVYLLLTKNVAAYKLSNLNLRRRLIMSALQSTFFTLLQYLLPLFFVGPEYTYYGLEYLRAFLAYFNKLLTGNRSVPHDNSIDYEMSSWIFPTETQCDYKVYGVMGPPETNTVTCTVAINEICSKLFMVIWWFVMVNLVIEVYSLCWLTICSSSVKTISCCFGFMYWPDAKKQADVLARFRHKRAMLLQADQKLARLRQQLEAGKAAAHRKSLLGLELSLHLNLDRAQYDCRRQMDEDDDELKSLKRSQAERKQFEAEEFGEAREEASKRASACSPKSWPQFVIASLGRLACCLTRRRRRRLEKEPLRDINIYYLLYLLYLRLGSSKSRTEEVIRMTAQALENYLLEQASAQQELRRHLLMQQQHPKQHHDVSSPLQLSSSGQSSISADNYELPIISDVNDDEKLVNK